MQMADRGDSSKVNTTIGDIVNNRHKDDDWYAYLDKGFTIYNLAKLSSCSSAGKGKPLVMVVVISPYNHFFHLMIIVIIIIIVIVS